MGDVVQLFDQLKGVVLVDRPGVVNGLVALFLDEAGFLENGLGEQVLERGFVEERAEFPVVGHVERGVVAVEPVDGGFQGEGRGSRRPGDRP